MAQQTAVEWLHYKWSNCKEWKWEEIEQWFEQAKEMEKEQIIEALPTDQDIDNYVDNLKGWVLIEKDFFRSGAKFMRNIIKNNHGKKMRQL